MAGEASMTLHRRRIRQRCETVAWGTTDAKLTQTGNSGKIGALKKGSVVPKMPVSVCVRRTGRADEADLGNVLADKNAGFRAAYRPGPCKAQ